MDTIKMVKSSDVLCQFFDHLGRSENFIQLSE